MIDKQQDCPVKFEGKLLIYNIRVQRLCYLGLFVWLAWIRVLQLKPITFELENDVMVTPESCSFLSTAIHLLAKLENVLFNRIN